MHPCTDEKKPTGSTNSTAGGTDRAIVPDTTSTSKTTSSKPGAHLLALYATINHMVLRAWCATPSSWGRGTIHTRPKGPVRSNTFSEAVAIPTEKRDFVSSKFLGLVRLHWPRMVLGGMGLPARMAARLRTCLKHPAHPTRVQTQTVALVPPEGAKTMTASPVASRSAAPTITPTTGNTHTHLDSTSEDARAFALLQASSDATMAKLYLARGNVPAARRKAVQLLKALQLLEVTA